MYISRRWVGANLVTIGSGVQGRPGVKFCHFSLTLTVVLTTRIHYRVSVWFSAKCGGEKVLKIGQYSAKIWAKICGLLCRPIL